MPRRRSTPEKPINSFTFIDSFGDQCDVEIWETYPNKGARGTHRRQHRSEIFDKVLIRISNEYYFSFSKHRRDVIWRSLYVRRYNSDLLSEIKKICIANKISLKRSTLYEVAREIRKAVKAMDSALAKYGPASHASAPHPVIFPKPQ